MFGVSFMEFSIIMLVLLFFFKPSDVLSFVAKIINYLEDLKTKFEDVKNEVFIEELEKEDIIEYQDPSNCNDIKDKR